MAIATDTDTLTVDMPIATYYKNDLLNDLEDVLEDLDEDPLPSDAPGLCTCSCEPADHTPRGGCGCGCPAVGLGRVREEPVPEELVARVLVAMKRSRAAARKAHSNVEAPRALKSPRRRSGRKRRTSERELAIVAS